MEPVLLAAIAPVILHRPLNEQRYIVQACVHSPYAFLLDRNQSDLEVFEGETVYNVVCVNFFISNCVDRNDYNNYKAVMIVKQPPYLKIPVKLEGQWFDDYALKVLYEFNGLISRPKRFIAALIVGITALIAIIASVMVSAIALSKEVHTASFVDQLSKNVSVVLTTQEIIDKNIENKVNALEEAVLLMGQEITNLRIKLSLRCHAEFKWMCVNPLQVNESIHSWECIKNHILGVWSHSDFSIDISKLHQDIQNLKQAESDFSSQWLSNSLFENLEGYLSHGSFSTIMINVAMCLCLLVLICVIAPCLFRILNQSVSVLSTEFHTYALKK